MQHQCILVWHIISAASPSSCLLVWFNILWIIVWIHNDKRYQIDFINNIILRRDRSVFSRETRLLKRNYVKCKMSYSVPYVKLMVSRMYIFTEAYLLIEAYTSMYDNDLDWTTSVHVRSFFATHIGLMLDKSKLFSVAHGNENIKKMKILKGQLIELFLLSFSRSILFLRSLRPRNYTFLKFGFLKLFLTIN